MGLLVGGALAEEQVGAPGVTQLVPQDPLPAEGLLTPEAQEALRTAEPVASESWIPHEVTKGTLEACEAHDDVLCRALLQVHQGDLAPGPYPDEDLEQAVREAEADG